MYIYNIYIYIIYIIYIYIPCISSLYPIWRFPFRHRGKPQFQVNRDPCFVGISDGFPWPLGIRFLQQIPLKPQDLSYFCTIIDQ